MTEAIICAIITGGLTLLGGDHRQQQDPGGDGGQTGGADPGGPGTQQFCQAYARGRGTDQGHQS